LLLLVATEYGSQIFPPLWGIPAVLRPRPESSRPCCSSAARYDLPHGRFLLQIRLGRPAV
jgi:hypothetical protein